MRSAIITVSVATALLGFAPRAQAHCQVPCGIYDDHNRVHQMREDLTTITKADKQIRALAKKKDAQSKNQLVRWVVTKEHHAEKIMRTISDYFMAQRIKPSAKGYKTMLVKHHKVMLAAMKCKQSVDDKSVANLGKALDGIAGYWKVK
jgi:nickel superoxide dismutase